MKKSDWLALGLIGLLALIGVKALFQPGFYTSHDGEHQVLRLFHFVRGLKDGQIPVRWAGPPAFKGFGYPLFVFTYCLPFYLATPFYLAGLSLTDAIKAVFILTYLLSGWVMYWAQKKIWKDQWAALIGAVFYLWAPWRFSTIFVRASLGEAVSYLFFPLLIGAIFEEKPILAAFALACLLLSHSMLFLLFLPFLIALMIFFVCQSQEKKKRSLFYLLVFLLAAGLTAFYWLPATIEKQYTSFFHILSGFYRQHFVALKQLVYSKWGYGFSQPGVEQDAMSFQVGLAQWAVVGLVIFLLGWQWFKKKKLLADQKFTLLLVILFGISIFLMTPGSDFVWRALTPFFTFDFPFRLLAVVVLLASLLSGGLAKRLPWLLMACLLALLFYSNRNHLRVNQYTFWPDSYYENLTASSTSFDEYRPTWVKVKEMPERKQDLEIEKGKGEIISQEIRSHWQKFEVKIEEPSRLQLNTIYFPGWQLWVDGEKKAIETLPLTGLMAFALAPGEHQVMFKFDRTHERIVAEMASLFSVGLIAFRLKKRWRKKRKK